MAASDAPPVVDDEDAPVPIKQRTQPHLMPQDAKTVDPSKLTALSPEVVSSVVWIAFVLHSVFILELCGCNDPRWISITPTLAMNFILLLGTTTLSLTNQLKLPLPLPLCLNTHTVQTDFSSSHNQRWNDWSRRSRKKYCRQGDIWRPNCAI